MTDAKRMPVDEAEESACDQFRPLPTLDLEALERVAIRQALAQCGGNRTQACDVLGISVRTLQRKIKRYHLPELPPSTCRSSQERAEPVT